MPNRPDRLSRSGPTIAPQKPEGALEMANAADAPAAPSAGNCKYHKAVAPQFPRQVIFRPITVMQARLQEPDGDAKASNCSPASQPEPWFHVAVAVAPLRRGGRDEKPDVFCR